jgi:hypothetical protein
VETAPDGDPEKIIYDPKGLIMVGLGVYLMLASALVGAHP